MLGEVADVDFVGAEDIARQRLQASGDQLGEGRFAVAVLAEQRDAVVVVDAQIEVAQDRLVRVVAGRCAFDAEQRAGEHLGRVGQQERDDAVVNLRRDRLHLGQRLDAALRLARLRGLGLEAVDEGLDMAALVVLLLLELQFEPLLLAPRLLEIVVAARVEGELAAVEMQDAVQRRG